MFNFEAVSIIFVVSRIFSLEGCTWPLGWLWAKTILDAYNSRHLLEFLLDTLILYLCFHFDGFLLLVPYFFIKVHNQNSSIFRCCNLG